MSQQIKKENLERQIAHINKILNRPETPWRRDEQGKLHANVGNFHLDSAYGGYRVEEMRGEKGGVRNVLGIGYVSKRELWSMLDAFMLGIEYGKNQVLKDIGE